MIKSISSEFQLSLCKFCAELNTKKTICNKVHDEAMSPASHHLRSCNFRQECTAPNKNLFNPKIILQAFILCRQKTKLQKKKISPIVELSIRSFQKRRRIDFAKSLQFLMLSAYNQCVFHLLHTLSRFSSKRVKQRKNLLIRKQKINFLKAKKKHVGRADGC